MPPTTITKRDTETLKGVAILMMLWLHLFHGLPWVSLSTPIFIIEGIPLVTILTNATNPVYFLLFYLVMVYTYHILIKVEKMYYE